MHTLGSRSLLWIAVSVLASAALPAAAAAADDRVRTYRVENVRTAKDRAAVARTGVAVVGADHGALIVTASSSDARRLRRLPYRVLRGSAPRLPARASGLRARAADFPSRRRHVPQLRGAVGRHAGDRQRVPVDRAALQPRHELRGAPDLGAEGLRQRRHRRDDRARGPLHPQPARPRAPHRRDGAVPAQRADEQVRHRLADHQRGQHAGDLDRPEREPRRVGVRRRHRRLPVLAQEPPAQQRARRRSAPI